MRLIRASEIVTYVYCQRAWWFQSQDALNANMTWLDSGQMAHGAHGRRVVTLGLIRLFGYGLVLAGVAVAAGVLASRWLG
jgi:hypothetical protein